MQGGVMPNMYVRLPASGGSATTEVLVSTTPLTGNAPVGVVVGVDTTNGVFYSSNGVGGVWSVIPISATQISSTNGATSVEIIDAVDDSIDFNIDGVTVMTLSGTKLSLNGIMIDPPTALELLPQAAVPAAAINDDNTLWINTVGGQLHRGTINLEPKERVFANNTLTAPAIAGKPTVGEIAAFLLIGGYKDTIVYYTGTNVTTDPIKRVYHVDKLSNVTLLWSAPSTEVIETITPTATNTIPNLAQLPLVDGDVKIYVNGLLERRTMRSLQVPTIQQSGHHNLWRLVFTHRLPIRQLKSGHQPGLGLETLLRGHTPL
jgi:hypothetical protein